MDGQTAIYTSFSEPPKTPMAYKVLVVMGMMTLMGGTLTGVMTYLNLGYGDTFFTDWLRSFLTAAVTVMPIGFMMIALITQVVGKLLPNASENRRNLVIGVAVACIMESGMAFATTLNNLGFANKTEFFAGWLEGVLGALPVALALMIITSMTIKPKVEQILNN